jgi:plasmid stabilization system protein ParE
VARLSYSQRVLDDLARLTDFLLATDPAAAVQTAEVIEEAVNILHRHPLIGRPAEAGLRELLISRGKTGCVALYRHQPEADAILVLAIRHQRELGFGTPP